MKNLIFIGLIATLISCSSGQVREDQIRNSINPDLKVADFNKDKQLCWYEANKAALGSSGGAFVGLSYWMQQNNINDAKLQVVIECMKIKGWSWK